MKEVVQSVFGRWTSILGCAAQAVLISLNQEQFRSREQVSLLELVAFRPIAKVEVQQRENVRSGIVIIVGLFRTPFGRGGILLVISSVISETWSKLVRVSSKEVIADLSVIHSHCFWIPAKQWPRTHSDGRTVKIHHPIKQLLKQFQILHVVFPLGLTRTNNHRPLHV